MLSGISLKYTSVVCIQVARLTFHIMPPMLSISYSLNSGCLLAETVTCFTCFMKFTYSHYSQTTSCWWLCITWRNVWPSDQPHWSKSWWCASSHLCVLFPLSSDQSGGSTLRPQRSSHHMSNICHGSDRYLVTKKTTFLQVSEQIPILDFETSSTCKQIHAEVAY